MSAEPVDVVEVLKEVHTTLESSALRTGVQIVLEPTAADLPGVWADRTRFAQIVMNFGSNAIKYNRPEGVVRIRASVAAPRHVRVSVVDTGIGVPPEKQDKLFQPFQRAGQETGPIEGTGIGLVISKRLAELMAGSVGFESTLGAGSTFWVELPAHVASPVARGVEARADKPTIGAAEQPTRRILYVEDNPANVAFMRDALGDLERIELVTVPNAEIGIELAAHHAPDVIVMDINLPGMSGLEALNRLRAGEATSRIPVIALTAAASERDKARGIQAGFYEYLTKPVKVDELLRAVESVLHTDR
jgi:CheY-like chemotaxis protein